MDMLKFLFQLVIFFPVIHASHDCQYSWCRDNNILIRFPFQLEGDHQHPYCGYPNPGFNLTCSTNDSKTVLTLPYTKGQFYVRKINYLKQQIQVYDPHDCLPNRLLSLNLSGSPFIAKFLHNYTLLSCQTRNIGSQFIPVRCLSNSTHFVSAIPSVNLTNSLPQSCYVFRNISVPVAIRQTRYVDIASYLQLAWHSPDCRYCELQGGMCGFESTSGDQIHCFTDHQTGPSQHDGLGVSRIVLSSIAGAAMMCAIGIAFFTCFQRRRRTIISPQPEAITTIMSMRMGLDESTIESFEKVVLGESRRLPPGVAPNDGCCSICLSEYNSMDIIRCIPECTHCFHAYCIDEWLRLNATCPLCRNSPSPPHSLAS